MHNGQIGGYSVVRRRIEDMIPDDLYHHRAGTTDSEAIFLAALAAGLDEDPVRAIGATLRRVKAFMEAAGIVEALRFTAALTDGASLYAFRWASDGKPATLYHREHGEDLLVVSEPLDRAQPGWQALPASCALVARRGAAPSLVCMDDALSREHA